MNKLTLVATNYLTDSTKAFANAFALRNVKDFTFVTAPLADMNKVRDVILVANNFAQLRSALVRRIAFAGYRPNAHITTYILTPDACVDGKPVRVRNYAEMNDIETPIRNANRDKFLADQIEAELADLRKQTGFWFNQPCVKAHFGDMVSRDNFRQNFQEVIDIMSIELQESGFDFYTAGTEYQVEKMSNFTCTTDDNDYLNRGETSSHTELRVRSTYALLPLDIVRNWVQLQFYVEAGFTPDHTEEEREFNESLADVNVDWCHSHPVSDTISLSDITVHDAQINHSANANENHGSAIFTSDLS